MDLWSVAEDLALRKVENRVIFSKDPVPHPLQWWATELFCSLDQLPVSSWFLRVMALQEGHLQAFGFGVRVVGCEMARVVSIAGRHYKAYQAGARIAHR